MSQVLKALKMLCYIDLVTKALKRANTVIDTACCVQK